MRKYLIPILLFPTVCIASVVEIENSSNYNRIYDLFKDYPSKTLYVKGNDYFVRNVLDSSMVCFTIISNRYHDKMNADEKQLCAEAFNSCGIIYFYYYNYAKAYSYYLKAIDVGCEMIEYFVYNNIAGIYYYYNDFAKMNEYLNMSYDWCKENKDWEAFLSVFNNVMNQNFQIDSLKNIENKLIEFKILDIPNSNFYQYILSANNGMLDVLYGNYDQAIVNFEESINYTDSLWMSIRHIYQSYFNIAKVHSFMGNYDLAIDYMGKCEAIALENNYSEIKMVSYEMLEDYYGKLGNEKMALDYKLKYLNIRDSIFSTKEFGKIKDLQSFFEIEKIETQVNQLTAEQKLKNKILVIISGALVIIVLLLLLTYIQKKRLTKRNKDLFRKNVEAMKSEELEKQIRRESELKSKYQEAKIKEIEDRLKIYESPQSDEELIEDESEKDINNRYKGSKLSNKYKASLLDAIRNVMDNTNVFCSDDFSLDKLAILVNSNPKYVSQVINESLGKNFSNFLSEYRINEARKRLMDFRNYGNITNEAIALSLGFKSRTSFGRIFKNFTGLTPSEYQKIAKETLKENKATDEEMDIFLAGFKY